MHEQAPAAKMIAHLCRGIDAEVQRQVQVLEAHGWTSPCASCVAPMCCRDLVLLSRPAAHMLWATSRRRGTADEAGTRVRAWMAQHGETVRRLGTRPDPRAYRMLDVPCPLLVDGRCLVYADRPLQCRAHQPLGTPADCMMFHAGMAREITTLHELSMLETASAGLNLRQLAVVLDGWQPLGPALFDVAMTTNEGG